MILTINNVCKRYKDKKALDHVSLRMEGGSINGLLGPNGAGKTTLLRSITGITQIDEGDILFNGSPISEKSRRSIGYLPEERGLYPEMKVGEQLIYLAQLKGMTKETAQVAVRQWLRKFQLSSAAEKKTNELSKGMQQKVQFIAAVIHQPELLILDEPFSGFDPINTELIKGEILALKKQGVCIILSTHNMTSVEEICDNVALINHSRIILEGNTSEIRQRYNTGKFILKGESNGRPNNGTTQSSQFTLVENGDWIVNKRPNSPINNNDLLKELMEYFSITSFIEAQPSMNEIFLNAVNANNKDVL